MRTFRAGLGALCGTLLCLTGCAARFASSSADLNTPRDDILYKLPDREYIARVTYELQHCVCIKVADAKFTDDECITENDSLVKVKVADIAVDSELVPSKSPNDWFQIDPGALDQFFSSVDPATIELQKGLLTTVGLKSTGAATESLSLARAIAGVAALSANKDQDVRCTAAAREALAEDRKSKQKIDEYTKKLGGADEEFFKDPSEDLERKLKILDARLTTARAERTKARDTALRKTIVYRIRPASMTQVERKAATAAPKTPITLEAQPTPYELADWFSININNPLPDSLTKAFQATLAFTELQDTGTDAARPGNDAFAGIYYRRPATAKIVLSVATQSGAQDYRILNGNELIPQMGSLQRVRLKGRVFGSRNLSVGLDEHGDLKKYEVTSKGMAAAMTESLKQVEEAFANPKEPTELEALTQEVDLLKKKKELIDAKAALEVAAPDAQ